MRRLAIKIRLGCLEPFHVAFGLLSTDQLNTADGWFEDSWALFSGTIKGSVKRDPIGNVELHVEKQLLGYWKLLRVAQFVPTRVNPGSSFQSGTIRLWTSGFTARAKGNSAFITIC